MYNEMLIKLTVRETNLNKIEDVSRALQILSKQEEACYNYIIKKKLFTRSFGYVILEKKQMDYILNKYDYDILVTVARHIADELAKESNKMSMIVYFDDHEGKNLYQFRMRRSFNFKKYDLRNILDLFEIDNGGGHEGAIGFRFPYEKINDVKAFTKNILDRVEEKVINL